MPSKFKLLILDYGGVYSFPYVAKNFDTIMLKTFGRVPNESERQAISEKSQLLASGKISTMQHIALLGEILQVAELPSIELFETTTIEVTNPPTPEMAELVKVVRQSGIKVSLLSDMYLFEAKLTRPWGRYEGFDYVSLSAEAGMTKREPRFFKNTLSHFNIDASEALFVDDTARNTETAQAIGITTLLADKQQYPRVSDLVGKIYELLETNQS